MLIPTLYWVNGVDFAKGKKKNFGGSWNVVKFHFAKHTQSSASDSISACKWLDGGNLQEFTSFHKHWGNFHWKVNDLFAFSKLTLVLVFIIPARCCRVLITTSLCSHGGVGDLKQILFYVGRFPVALMSKSPPPWLTLVLCIYLNQWLGATSLKEFKALFYTSSM